MIDVIGSEKRVHFWAVGTGVIGTGVLPKTECVLYMLLLYLSPHRENNINHVCLYNIVFLYSGHRRCERFLKL